MQLKALTATLVAVFASGIIGTVHVKALSQTTSNIKQTAAVKEASTVVPGPTQITVVPGDTLSSIAAKNGTTYVRIFDNNPGIADPNKITPGEVVVIPTASAQLPDRYGQFESALEVAAAETSSQPATPIEPAQTSSAPVTSVATAAPANANDGVWERLAGCEASGNWSADTGNGFYGGLQFTLSSWQAMGGTGLPSQASEATQIALAQKLQADQGWGAWPVCSAKLGL